MPQTCQAEGQRAEATDYLDVDLHDPATILAGAAKTLDFSWQAAIMILSGSPAHLDKALWVKARAEFATSWTAMAASSSPAVLFSNSTPVARPRAGACAGGILAVDCDASDAADQADAPHVAVQVLVAHAQVAERGSFPGL